MEAEDARKKRVSDHVESPVAAAKEKLKKLKGEELSSSCAADPDHDETPVRSSQPPHRRGRLESDEKETTGNAKHNDSESTALRSRSSPSPSSGSATWDLESALLHVARMGSSVDPERVASEDGDESSIKYRVAHSGDASTLAGCYRKLRDSGDSPKENSALEMWLAEGLGDEDKPPFVFALLAEVFSEAAPAQIGSAALLTQTWCDGKRFVRVEWMYSMNDAVERSMWLRLASLGLLLSCDLLVSEKARRDARNKR
jgi:hypothetical protein